MARNASLKLIYFLFLLVSFKTNAQVIHSLDLMPFEPEVSIKEMSISNFSNKLMSRDVGKAVNNSLKVENNFSLETGFLTSGPNKLGISLKFSDYQNQSQFSDEDVKLIKSNILYLSKNYLNNWDRIFNISYAHMPKYAIYCYEGDTYSIGGSYKNCKIDGKSFYVSSSNGLEEPALSFSSKSINLGFGLRKQAVQWDKKITYAVKLESNLIDNKTIYGSGFSSFNKTNLKSIPLSGKFNDHFLRLSAFQTRRISEDWALGAGITSYHLYNSNNQKGFYKKTKKNIIINSRITKKMTSNLYISFGASISTNYLFGVEPIIFNERTSEIFQSSYGEVKLSLGFIDESGKEKFSNQGFDIPKELMISEKEDNQKKPKIINPEGKKFANVSLKEYALSYAEKYDNSINIKIY